ncbi:MAG: hypothetical protein ACTHNY_06470 [Solirubrobacterales bacterium]
MRAATVIVGAIAVSSCLIALSLVLTSGSDSITSSARQPSRPDAAKPKAGDTVRTSPAAASGPVQCNVEVTVEGGSCFLGKNVLAAYDESGAATVTALDPQSGEEVSFDCAGTAPAICTSHSGVRVYLAPPEG